MARAAACQFVAIDDVWLPAVARVVKHPEYRIDAERAISGNLRIANQHRIARAWTVELRGVTGEDAVDVQALLMGIPAPRRVNVMGEVTDALIQVQSVEHTPLIRPAWRGASDLGRVDITFTVTEIMAGGTWEYAVFTEDGVWSWEDSGSPDRIDILMLGGGGGGGTGVGSGSRLGGGGGAGGLAILHDVTITSSLTIEIGEGGASGEAGSPSYVGPEYIDGGGSGGGGSGGSGGGGSSTTTTPAAAGGSGIPDFGNDGGAAIIQSDTRQAGGGGGFTSPGYDGWSDPRDGYAGGRGGDGITLSSLGWYPSGAPTAIAGGGGGAGEALTAASGGLGGGGSGGVAGIVAVPPEAGVANTGGGGGGGAYHLSSPSSGAAGGSGLVIIRWRPR